MRRHSSPADLGSVPNLSRSLTARRRSRRNQNLSTHFTRQQRCSFFEKRALWMPSWGGHGGPPVQGLPILYEPSSFPHNRFESQLFPIFLHVLTRRLIAS